MSDILLVGARARRIRSARATRAHSSVCSSVSVCVCELFSRVEKKAPRMRMLGGLRVMEGGLCDAVVVATTGFFSVR